MSDCRYVSTDIVLTDIRGDAGISAVLEWDETDPWAVTVNFPCGEPWVIGRELFAAGLHRDASLGDVHFCGDVLHPDRRLMILDSPDGRAVFRFDPIEVAFFVGDVDRHVRLAAPSEELK